MPKKKASGRGGWRPGAGRKPELKDPVRITVDLEGPGHQRLRREADKRDVPLSALVREAVRAFLRRK